MALTMFISGLGMLSWSAHMAGCVTRTRLWLACLSVSMVGVALIVAGAHLGAV